MGFLTTPTQGNQRLSLPYRRRQFDRVQNQPQQLLRRLVFGCTLVIAVVLVFLSTVVS